MVEYKDVMLAVAGVAATFTGFGLVFLAIVTTSFIATRLGTRGLLLLTLPALNVTLAGIVAAFHAISWLVGHTGTEGHPDLSYAIAKWAFFATVAGSILTAGLVLLAHFAYLAEFKDRTTQ